MNRFINALICAIICLYAQAARADETEVATSAVPVRSATFLDEEVKLDPFGESYAQARDQDKPRGYADTYIIDDVVVGGSLFGGVSKTSSKGDEQHYLSMWGGGVANVRFHLGDFTLGAPIRVEAGLAVKGMSGLFDGAVYRSQWQSLTAMGEVVLRHDPRENLSLWSLSIRAGVQYTRNEGKSKTSTYESTEEVTYAALEAQLDLYWPFAIDPVYEGWVTIRGAPVKLREGFFPVSRVWVEGLYQAHGSRRSSVTRAGGHDRAHQNRITTRVTQQIYRFVTETVDTDVEWLWEVSPYVFGGITVLEANGYASLEDGTPAYQPFAGVGVEVVLNRFCSMTVEGLAWQEIDGPGRNGGSIQVSFNIWGW